MRNYIVRSDNDEINPIQAVKVSTNNRIKLEEIYPKINILIVDDHPENLLALEAVLKSSNYHLVRANSGKEALKCVLSQDFAVILLDVQMPGLNGFETAKMIKSREKSKHIPIIFITAISQSMDHVLQGYGVGAVDYIFKPFHPETLKLKIEEFVKIYENQEHMKLQFEFRRKLELKEINEELTRTTLYLRKSEELARIIGETLVDTIITFNEKGHILSVNPAVRDMLGYSVEEVLGQLIVQFLPDVKQEDDRKILKINNYPLKETKGRVIESIALHKNRNKVPIEIQTAQTNIGNEQIFVCSIRDITERKQIEKERKRRYGLLEELVKKRTQELRVANLMLQQEIEERKKMTDDLYRSQELFFKIFESSPCLISIRSYENGQYLNVNQSWQNHTGYEYDEIKEQKTDVCRIVEKNDGDKHSLRMEESIDTIKVQYQTKAGEVREGILSNEIIELHDKKCILTVITDITERVQLEKEMARLDRLNLVGEMAAGIAHEIRNPMTTVRGFLELSKQKGEQLSEEHIDLMLEELKRANSIITEFLNLAKNKASNKILQPLNPVIEALYPLIQAEATLSNKSVCLQLEKCPDFNFDEKEVRQMILNLALNGLESMTPGGILTIKSYIQDQTVVLEIKDQGNGIKSEFIDKVGIPFFTTKEMGTGLGLAICYSIAERHNAAIDFKTGNQGTTFFIRFPKNEQG